MDSSPLLLTVPEIARRVGCTTRQAEYAVSSYRIEETRRIGIIRLFDEASVARITSALRRTGALPRLRRVIQTEATAHA